jgi:hypothetical protein
MAELLWFGDNTPRGHSATCKHENLQDSNLVSGVYCKSKSVKVCLDCKKGFIEGESNKALVIEVSAAHHFFEVPVGATKEEVMNIACDVVGTYGEDVSTIIVFDEEPKIKWKEFYYCD